MPSQRVLRVICLLWLGLAVTAGAAASSLPGPDAARPGELLVRFKSHVTASTLDGEARRLATADSRPEALRQALVSAEGAEVTAQLDRLQVVRLQLPAGRTREEVLANLLASPLVEYVEPVYIRRAFAPLPNGPNDPLYQHGFLGGTQWGLQLIEADRVVAENLLPNGAPIVIAILDTGIDLQHEDLVSKLVPGMNFINTGGTGDDDNGHGTHVAGIAAAATNNGIGIAGTASTPSVKLMPVKILDAEGTGDDAGIAQGVIWAVEHGARVLNFSFGGPFAGRVLEDAVHYAYERGCVITAAAGNFALGDGHGNFNPIFYPAAYPPVIAVAACNSIGSRAAYSEYGSFIDVAAPGGEGIISAGAILSTKPNLGRGTYGYLIGTSMASPFVAGAAAMLLSQDPTRTPEQVENLLTSTAGKIGTDAYVNGWNPYLGWGVINLYRAMRQASTFAPKSGGRLSYNYPNPFAPARGEQTLIIVPVAAGREVGEVKVEIYDALGRRVRTLQAAAGQIGPGGGVPWDGRNDRGQLAGNGVYLYRLLVNGVTHQNKIAVKNY